MFWVKIPLRRAAGDPGSPPGAGTTLVVGKYQLDLDNSVLRVSQQTLDTVLAKLPANKTWGGKAFNLHGGRLAADGSVMTLDFTVTRNPVPLAVVLGGLGVIGLGLVAFLVVKELRKLVEVADLKQGWFLAALVIVVLAVIGLVLLIRKVVQK